MKLSKQVIRLEIISLNNNKKIKQQNWFSRLLGSFRILAKKSLEFQKKKILDEYYAA